MDVSGLESAVIVATRVLAFAAYLLYLARTRKRRMLRGYPLILGIVSTLALCAVGWSLAAVDAFSGRSSWLAAAATVPFVQVLVLVTSLQWFIARFGRDPRPLPASQFAHDTAADTSLHAFVVFVLTIGAFALVIELQQASALRP